MTPGRRNRRTCLRTKHGCTSSICAKSRTSSRDYHSRRDAPFGNTPAKASRAIFLDHAEATKPLLFMRQAPNLDAFCRYPRSRAQTARVDPRHARSRHNVSHGELLTIASWQEASSRRPVSIRSISRAKIEVERSPTSQASCCRSRTHRRTHASGHAQLTKTERRTET